MSALNYKKLEVCNIFQEERIKRGNNSQLKPVIFSNVVQHWPAIQKWTPDFIANLYPNHTVNVSRHFPALESPYLYKEEKHHIQKKALKEFIKLMQAGEPCYVAQGNIADFEQINIDYDFADLIPNFSNQSNVDKSIWIGNKTRSGLHFDYADNFLIQIYGTKKVYLAAPNQTKFLYPLPENFTKTQVNPMEPNLTRYPKLKNAVIFEGTIHPGDALFIPKGWYHYIHSPEQSISLNCWYGPTMTPKELIQIFLQTGRKTWFEFAKGFLLYGVIGKPFPGRLYSSFHMGKLAYEYILSRFKLKK